MIINDDIWSVVQQHTWKWQTGRTDVVGIIWHATRSGIAGRTPSQEYFSTLNWFKSPNNAVLDSSGNKWYGGMAHYVIGGGKVCRAMPEELVPRFSAGIHDFRAISIEVGQARNGDPYDARDIELCHELAAELSTRYGFPLGRIPFVNASNQGWPGEVGHEDTAQGVGQGKSDPGDEFWTQYEGEDMANFTDAEAYKLEAVWLALTAGDMSLIEAWNANGNSLLKGYSSEQEKLNKHITNHPNSSAGKTVTGQFSGVIES